MIILGSEVAEDGPGDDGGGGDGDGGGGVDAGVEAGMARAAEFEPGEEEEGGDGNHQQGIEVPGGGEVSVEQGVDGALASTSGAFVAGQLVEKTLRHP